MKFQVGDLVTKMKGNQSGEVGVVTKVYNRNNEGYIILEIFSDGEILKWLEDWCHGVQVKNDV